MIPYKIKGTSHKNYNSNTQINTHSAKQTSEANCVLLRVKVTKNFKNEKFQRDSVVGKNNEDEIAHNITCHYLHSKSFGNLMSLA